MAILEGAFIELFPSNPIIGDDRCWEGAVETETKTCLQRCLREQTQQPSQHIYSGLLGRGVGSLWKPQTRSALCPSWHRAAGGQETVAGQGAWNGFYVMASPWCGPSESFLSWASRAGRGSLGGTKLCQRALQECFSVAKVVQGPKATNWWCYELLLGRSWIFITFNVLYGAHNWNTLS